MQLVNIWAHEAASGDAGEHQRHYRTLYITRLEGRQAANSPADTRAETFRRVLTSLPEDIPSPRSQRHHQGVACGCWVLSACGFIRLRCQPAHSWSECLMHINQLVLRMLWFPNVQRLGSLWPDGSQSRSRRRLSQPRPDDSGKKNKLYTLASAADSLDTSRCFSRPQTAA